MGKLKLEVGQVRVAYCSFAKLQFLFQVIYEKTSTEGEPVFLCCKVFRGRFIAAEDSAIWFDSFGRSFGLSDDIQYRLRDISRSKKGESVTTL